MAAGPHEGDAHSDEGVDAYPQVDPYAQAEAEAAEAEQAEQDALEIEVDRANAEADPTRGGGPQQIGEILRPAVDKILHRKAGEEDTTA